MGEEILSAVAGPMISGIVGNLFGADQPSAPTAEQMQTAVQKSIDPILMKKAAEYGVNLENIVKQGVAKAGFLKMAQQSPEALAQRIYDANKFKNDNKDMLGMGTDQSVAGNIKKNNLPLMDKALEMANKFYADPALQAQMQAKYGNGMPDQGLDAYLRDNLGKDYTNLQNIYMDQSDRVVTTDGTGSENVEGSKNTLGGGNTLSGMLNAYKQYKDYNDFIGNDATLREMNDTISKNIAAKGTTGSVADVTQAIKDYTPKLQSTIISKEQSQPSNLSTPEEEAGLIADAKKMMENNPAIKSLDEAMNMIRTAQGKNNADNAKTTADMADLAKKQEASGQKTAEQINLEKIIAGRAGMNVDEYAQKYGGVTSTQEAIRKQLADMRNMDKGAYVKDYLTVTGNPLKETANEFMAKNEADLRSKGMGFSTAVTDENTVVQNKLLSQLQTLAAAGSLEAQQVIQDAITSGIDLETALNNQLRGAATEGNQIVDNAITQQSNLQGQIVAQGQNALNNSAQTTTNIGNLNNANSAANISAANAIGDAGSQQLIAGTTAQTALNNLLKQKQDRELVNIGFQQQYDQQKRNDEQQNLNNILAIYSGQQPNSNNLAQAATNEYAANLTNAAAKNNQAGEVGAAIASAISKPKGNTSTAVTSNYTSYIPQTAVAPVYQNYTNGVAAGLNAGATAGAAAGKARTNNLYRTTE